MMYKCRQRFMQANARTTATSLCRGICIYDSQWQESEIISAIGCGTKQAVSFSAGWLDTFYTFFQMAALHMPVDLLSAGLEFKGKRERDIPDLIIYFERSKAPFVVGTNSARHLSSELT